VSSIPITPTLSGRGRQISLEPLREFAGQKTKSRMTQGNIVEELPPHSLQSESLGFPKFEW